MNYLEVCIEVKEPDLDPLTCILTDMGIAGFVVKDPRDIGELLDKKDDYIWDYVDESVREMADQNPSVTFYLDDSPEGRKTLAAVRQELLAAQRLMQPPQWEWAVTPSDQAVISSESSVTPPEWPATPADQAVISSELSVTPSESSAWTIEVKRVCDEDWKDNWKAYFKPAKITDRIVIKPTWETYERQSPDELIIQLDPGMAFGTGTHPTTTLCVKLMERYVTPGKSFLDVGCGSGILSIAAAMMGAVEITAVDIDPEAVRVTGENAVQNQLEQKIDVRLGDLTKGLSLTADLVAANLMADLVILLAKDVAKHLNEDGIFLSSGILVEKKQMVAEELSRQGFEILEAPEEGEWCAIAARRAK